MKIKRTLSAGVTSLGLVVGLAGFAGAATGTNNTTGPDSNNVVRNRTNTHVRVTNDNDLRATNSNDQYSSSGRAGVYHNTTGGGASTGDASNSNSLTARVSVDNSGATAASMPSGDSGSMSGTNSNTGPDSNNVVRNTVNTNVSVSNDNDLTVSNYNTQTATTGSATVAGNTTGGNATTGDASNTNSSSITFEVSN